MELTERQVQIAEWVRERDFLEVDDLAAQFDVTTQTIRRDLNTLCDHGLARRRHGGIERAADGGNLTYQSRQILNHAAKRAIATEIAKVVPNGASLAFSIGTTPEIVAAALVNHQNLRILTNNLNVAMIACANPTFEVTLPGGKIRSSDRDILGPEIERFFSSYNVDFGIYGAAGVEGDGALLDFHEDEVRARQAIGENCRESFLVLDHSKFNRRAHVRGGRIEQASRIFCDDTPPLHIVERLRTAETKLTICLETSE